MSVGSATESNSNTNGIGSSNSVNNSSYSNETTKTTDSISINSTNEITKSPNESLSETYASRTGISTAVVRANIENASVKKVDDRIYDGQLVGANGRTYPPNTPLSEIDAVTPRNGVTNDRTIVYVNGINTDLATQSRSMQEIADRTGSRVVGVHNSTAGSIRDIAQSLGDKLDIGNNPAVDTLADTIYNELKAGRQVDLMAHSQGGIITSRALTDVRNRLQLEDGMSRRNAERLLGNVRVETFGGAARRYPDGPQYVHYVNRRDFVPMAFGLRDWLNPFAHAGRGAVTHYFSDRSNPHGFNDTYLDQRVPFEQARQRRFN